MATLTFSRVTSRCSPGFCPLSGFPLPRRWGNLRCPSSHVLDASFLPGCPGSPAALHSRVLLDRGSGLFSLENASLSEVSRLL